MTADEQRKKALEQQLQVILSSLAQVCSELGVNINPTQLSAPLAPTPAPVLAPTPTPRAVALMPGQILLAQLGSLEIGFASTQVQELTRMVELSASVDPRPELEGYVNVRGKAVPVVNLRHLLGEEIVAHDPEQFLIFLRGRHGGRLAIVVDEVHDIHDVVEDQIQSREAMDLTRGFVQGVIQIDGRLVAIIDPTRLATHAL